MTRTVVIGATGHIGTYLVPRLVAAGHEVVAVSRGSSEPYQPHPAWDAVERLVLDREGLEAAGELGERIAATRPDVVVDLICFTPASNEQLVTALAAAGGDPHLVHIGTIWTHGHATAVPVTEDTPREPVGRYGTDKLAIERALLGEGGRVRATVLHPGHIVGAGWWPLNPAGHFSPSAFEILARGEELALPNFGLETVHHVHADDIAALVMAALARPEASVGEAFHAVSPQALTLRGYAEGMAGWFGHEPRLRFAPFEQWAAEQRPEDAAATFEHISRSPSCSMAKAERLLGFVPRFGSLAAVQDALAWQVAQGALDVEAAAPGSPARAARPPASPGSPLT